MADRGLWALSDPRLSNPSQDEKEVLLWSEELGSICSSLSPFQITSHAQPTSTLSRIKCERYIFIKKCVRSFIEVRHYCWLCFLQIFVLCICMWLYNIKNSVGIESSGLWYRQLEGFVFVYLLCLSTITHWYNYLSMRNTIPTLVAEEMYNNLKVPLAKQCKKNLTTTYLLPEQNWIERKQI